MTARRRIRLYATVTLGTIAAIASLPAHATEGYFQHGYGAVSKALAGAGAAFSQDASSMATNPAGLVNVENQVNFDVSFFSPNRELTGSGATGFPFAMPSGTFDSDNKLFFIPTAAVSYRIDDVSTFGVALYGNGGMNTEWEAMPRGPECGGGAGVFCAGRSGVDLTQNLPAADLCPGDLRRRLARRRADLRRPVLRGQGRGLLRWPSYQLLRRPQQPVEQRP